MTYFRYILGRCKGLRVDVKKPKDITTFLSCINALKAEIKTADSMLFEDIEKKVSEREAFVMNQSEKIKEMDEAYLELLDHEQVLIRAQKLQINGAV